MVSEHKLEAVIFDMDGVIFDSERALMEIWIELAEKYEMPDIEKVYISVCGTTHEATRETVLRAYGDSFPFEEVNHIAYVEREHRYRDGIPLKPGIRELLELLQKNQIRIALATSTRGDRAEEQLEKAGLLSYFDLLVTGDMVSKSKPDPEIFQKAIDLLKVSPDTAIIIEDSFNGIRAAHQTGAEVIMVPDLQQPDKEIAGLYDWCHSSLLEVCDHVSRRLVTKGN